MVKEGETGREGKHFDKDVDAFLDHDDSTIYGDATMVLLDCDAKLYTNDGEN